MTAALREPLVLPESPAATINYAARVSPPLGDEHASPLSSSPLSHMSSSASSAGQSPERSVSPRPVSPPSTPGPPPSFLLAAPVSTSPLPHSASSTSSLSSQRKGSHSRYPSSMPTFKGFHRKGTPITLQFSDVCLTLPNGQKILESVTGHFPHSRLTAIMGSSGCGKTSLLNVLAGRSGYAKMSGVISINHIPCSIRRLRSYAGFVPQDDILHADLTVYENLYYSAMLRLPATMKLAQKYRIVEDTIDMLGLDAVRNSRVGSVEKRGISGGQRKRVNIGTELVANPSLLFMDEPTSGLDASAALEVLSSLRRLADLGLTIITVVHQPRYSIYSSFHTVLFLGQGGQTVYLGRTEDAMPYFESLGFDLPENENPADFLLDVISGVMRERRPGVLQPGLHDGATADEEERKKHCAFPAAPLLAHTQSALAQLPILAASALNRTLSASQSLRNVASLIIDISGDNGPDDRQEPVIDFAEAWREHRREQEEERRQRKERSWSNASVKARTNSNASSTVLESPETRLRSVSDASVESVGSASSDKSAGSGSVERGLGAKVYAFLSKAERDRQEKERMDALFVDFQSNFVEPDDTQTDEEQKEGEDSRTTRPRYAAEGAYAHSVHHIKSLQGVAEEEDDGSSSCLSLFLLSLRSPPAVLDSGLRPSTSSSSDDYHSLSSLPRDHVFGLPTLHRAPTLFSQFTLLTRRLVLKLFRNWTYTVIDLLLVMFLAAVVGWVYGSTWSLGEYTSQCVFSTLCMGVCATVASLRLFGQDRLVYWRESLVGVNETSYWCSLILVELHRAFLYPLVFVSSYLPLAKPQASFLTVYGVFVATYFAMAGLGLLLSVVCRPVPALMVGTMLPLVVGGFMSGVNPPVNQMSPLMAFVSNLSFTRWAVEPLGMAEAAFPDKYGADEIWHWQQHFGFVERYWTNVGALVAMGVGFRLLTALALRRFSRTHKA